MKKGLRRIPSVDQLAEALADVGLPRRLVVFRIRQLLPKLRRLPTVPGPDRILADLRDECRRLAGQRLRTVINATGVVIHTNLGRAPLAADALDSLGQIGGEYSNLEFDLASGTRGSRGEYLEACLAVLSGAEAATLANNCAAALVLVLRHCLTATRQEVVISRGELVQIGGGFRIPEILECSGAVLREVGTTNRTTVDDYRRALGPRTAGILRVHRSNFAMEGFVESPRLADLASLARKHRVPLLEDLGSGALIDTALIVGLSHEPTPAESLKSGAQLVCYSGDKLMGGPQAGIIAGSPKRVAAIKRDPLFRAMRCDKLVFAALQATAERYLGATGDAPVATLTHELLRMSVEVLRGRSEAILKRIADLPLRVRVVEDSAQVGGGTLPTRKRPSIAIELRSDSVTMEEFSCRFRRAATPVIGYLAKDSLRLNLLTVFPDQDEALVQAIRDVAAGLA